jgi:hypothetical protein
LPETPDNRDPLWTPDVDASIELKVAQAMALTPRLELMSDGSTTVSQEDRRNMLLVTFREIVKATSLDTLMAAPPALLEQLSVLAIINNENVKGILVQVMRVYMMLWGTPETNEYARHLLVDMETAAREKLLVTANANPESLRWSRVPA